MRKLFSFLKYELGWYVHDAFLRQWGMFCLWLMVGITVWSQGYDRALWLTNRRQGTSGSH